MAMVMIIMLIWHIELYSRILFLLALLFVLFDNPYY